MLELARLVDDEDLEQTPRSTLARDIRALALEFDERDTILAARDDPPPGLEELRAVLLPGAHLEAAAGPPSFGTTAPG